MLIDFNIFLANAGSIETVTDLKKSVHILETDNASTHQNQIKFRNALYKEGMRSEVVVRYKNTNKTDTYYTDLTMEEIKDALKEAAKDVTTSDKDEWLEIINTDNYLEIIRKKDIRNIEEVNAYSPRVDLSGRIVEHLVGKQTKIHFLTGSNSKYIITNTPYKEILEKVFGAEKKVPAPYASRIIKIKKRIEEKEMENERTDS